jgi:hypothetical protein
MPPGSWANVKKTLLHPPDLIDTAGVTAQNIGMFS